MPFINLKTNVEITPEKEVAVKAGLGQAITALPGKTEAWLMVNIEDNHHMYFKGDGSKPLAFIGVQILGKASRADYEKMTAQLCELMERELSIAPDCVYVKYGEGEHWGWNGSNF